MAVRSFMPISEMKKFIIKVLLFFLAFVAADILSGWCFDSIRACAKGGSTYNNHYINDICEDDVLILGPSRAQNHYVSQIIEDSLQLSCYNCGESGNGIICAYARYNAIASRHKPKLVIYETLPVYDYQFRDPYSSYLWVERPYITQRAVKELFDAFGDRFDNFKLHSSLYRNNFRFLVYFKDLFEEYDGRKGYCPKEGICAYSEPAAPVAVSEEDDFEQLPVDSLRLSYVEKLFRQIQADGAKLVCVSSPYLYPASYWKDHLPIMDICEEMGVPFLGLWHMDGLTGNGEAFVNSGHMNCKGAEEFTKRLVPKLKEIME